MRILLIIIIAKNRTRREIRWPKRLIAEQLVSYEFLVAQHNVKGEELNTYFKAIYYVDSYKWSFAMNEKVESL